jgi:hypothetical protein
MYAVNGDDYIGCHNKSTNEKLSKVITELGLKLHPTKDFVTFNGMGIFAEELVAVGRRRVYNSISLKPLNPVGEREKGGTKQPWLNGPTLCKTIDRAPLYQRGVLKEIVTAMYVKEFSMLRTSGIHPTSPRWCGGAGFPGTPSVQLSRLGRGILGQGPMKVVEIISEFTSAWGRMSSIAMDDARSRVQRVYSEYGLRPNLEEEVIPLSEYVTQQCGRISFAYTLAGFPPETSKLSITRLGRRIQGLVNRWFDVAGWVVPEVAHNLQSTGKLVEPVVNPIYTDVVDFKYSLSL